jgi:hypothetical protein
MFYIHLDLGPLEQYGDDLQRRATELLQAGAALLAAQTREHIIEQVQQKLHSTRETFIDHLSYKQVDAKTWMVSLDKAAVWIEEGMERHEMIDDLLKSAKARTAKDGSRYLSVPFKHNKAPTATPVAQHSLQETLKSEMRKRGIAYGGIETNANGTPRLGLLHTFSILDKPIKTEEGPGQGHGAIGAVRQGMTGIPFLQNVRIYQRQVMDKNGVASVQKAIMTFRTVSSKQKGSGRWVHPGLKPKKFLDEAYEWALQQWETKIKDQILDELTTP